MQKAQADIVKASTTNVNGVDGDDDGKSDSNNGGGGIVIYEDGTVSVSPRVSSDSRRQSGISRGAGVEAGGAGGGEDDNASTRAMLSPSTPNGPSSQTIGDSGAETQAPIIPTIRVSTESDRATREREQEQEDQDTLAGHASTEGVETTETQNTENGVKENGVEDGKNGNVDVVEGLEKPVQAAAVHGEEKGGAGHGEHVAPSPEPFSFSNKRLCERWLDNLFMVLYEVSVYCPSVFPRGR